MNTLNATLTTITASEHLSLLSVSVGSDTLHLLLAEIPGGETREGNQVTLAFKETEVILLNTSVMTTANILSGRISDIQHGAVLTQVSLAYQDTTVRALVPTLTFHTMGALLGDTVGWMVSPNEISLLRGSSHGN